ncbi:hypothetical protein [Roseomonas marmotae]|nr:hypothetical protein [Roseomonas marmotae]
MSRLREISDEAQEGIAKKIWLMNAAPARIRRGQAHEDLGGG